MALKPPKPLAPIKIPRLATVGKPTGYETGAYPNWSNPAVHGVAAKAPAPYNWAGAANVNWFPGLKGAAPGSLAGIANIGAGWNQGSAVAPQQQPGYGSLIAGDWEVQDAESQMAAQMARARGDFQAGLRQQFIDLGLSDTAQLGNLGQYIDADTIKDAVANKYSATAQNAQNAERQRAQGNAALAARGLLSSGQTTKSQTDVTAAQEGANYSALRNFLSGGASGLSGLGDLEAQMAQGVAQARYAAAARAAEMAQYGAAGGPGYGYGGFNLGMELPQSFSLAGLDQRLAGMNAPGLRKALSPNSIAAALGKIRW